MSKFWSILSGLHRWLSHPGPTQIKDWAAPQVCLDWDSFLAQKLAECRRLDRARLHLWRHSPPRLEWALPQVRERSLGQEFLRLQYLRHQPMTDQQFRQYLGDCLRVGFPAP